MKVSEMHMCADPNEGNAFALPMDLLNTPAVLVAKCIDLKKKHIPVRVDALFIPDPAKKIWVTYPYSGMRQLIMRCKENKSLQLQAYFERPVEIQGDNFELHRIPLHDEPYEKTENRLHKANINADDYNMSLVTFHMFMEAARYYLSNEGDQAKLYDAEHHGMQISIPVEFRKDYQNNSDTLH